MLLSWTLDSKYCTTSICLRFVASVTRLCCPALEVSCTESATLRKEILVLALLSCGCMALTCCRVRELESIFRWLAARWRSWKKTYLTIKAIREGINWLDFDTAAPHLRLPCVCPPNSGWSITSSHLMSATPLQRSVRMEVRTQLRSRLRLPW